MIVLRALKICIHYRLSVAVCCIGWLLIGPGANLNHAATEYEIKAAFLFNFTKHVEWPAKKLPVPNSPILIGVLGRDPFEGHLEDALRGKNVNGRPLIVRRFGLNDDFWNCHVLFVSSHEARHLPSILEKVEGTSVLTIGDFYDFARKGGIINFVIENNRVRFQINVDAARRADLKLHSTLLNLGRIIREER